MSQVKANKRTKLHVRGSLNEVVESFKDDIGRFELGETVQEDHLTFENWKALFNVLTPKRYELLQHVHRNPEPSVRALSRSLDRDFKRVYEDVKALADVGLLEWGEDGLRAEYAAIETSIAL